MWELCYGLPLVAEDAELEDWPYRSYGNMQEEDRQKRTKEVSGRRELRPTVQDYL